MKKLPVITTAIVFGLGGICNETHTQLLAQKATIEHEQNKMQLTLRYSNDDQRKLVAIDTKIVSRQDAFFLTPDNQTITDKEVTSLSLEESLSANEIELLKAQAHEMTNNTNIIGL